MKKILNQQIKMHVFKYYLFLLFFTINAQNDNELNNKKLKLNINFMYGSEKLNKEINYSSSLQNEFKINAVKFYISNLKINYNNGTTNEDVNGYHLIDFDKNINEFYFNGEVLKDIKSISFLIGVDEKKSLSGEMEGDLDPLNGMFWSWQSGFSSFKLEGVSPNCLTRKNEFILHIGGYQNPYNSLREINLLVNNPVNKNIININVDLKKLMNNIDLSKDNHIMSPGVKAMDIADYYKKIFSIND